MLSDCPSLYSSFCLVIIATVLVTSLSSLFAYVLYFRRRWTLDTLGSIERRSCSGLLGHQDLNLEPDYPGEDLSLGIDLNTSPGSSFVGQGSLGLVYKFPLNANNGPTRMVAVKLPLVSNIQPQVKANQRLKRETCAWRLLHHENIVPYLGYVKHREFCRENAFAMVSPYYQNGSLAQFLEIYRSDLKHVHRLNIVRNVVAGLDYLHRHDIVHGDLHPSNVIINDEGAAQLCDFGRSRVIGVEGYDTCVEPGCTEFIAPELWKLEEAFETSLPIDTTTKTDIYSFAMVFYIVLTNNLASLFHAPQPNHPAFRIKIARWVRDGRRPDRPSHTVISDDLWDIIVRCWSPNPSDRMDSSSIVSLLGTSDESNFAPPTTIVPSHEANVSINEFTRSRVSIEDLTSRLTKKSILARGDHSDIYLSELKSDSGSSLMVAVKFARPKSYANHRSEEDQTRLRNQARLWNTLDHENILRILGVCEDSQNSLGMVVPLQQERNVNEYLDSRGNNARTLSLLLDVISGLEYLHDRQIVHGDLRPSQILVNSDGRLLISGFGQIREINDVSFPYGDADVASGSIRYMAPELFSSGDRIRPNLETDIYSFSMTALEILSGEVPYYKASNECILILRVPGGLRPRLEDYSQPSFFLNEVWPLLEHCWEQHPDFRIGSSKAKSFLRSKCDISYHD